MTSITLIDTAGKAEVINRPSLRLLAAAAEDRMLAGAVFAAAMVVSEDAVGARRLVAYLNEFYADYRLTKDLEANADEVRLDIYAIAKYPKRSQA